MATTTAQPCHRRRALTEAMEELQYWRRQAAIRTHPQGITEAKARVAAWKTTVAQRQSDLATRR